MTEPPQQQALSWLSVKNELNICRHENGNIDFDRYRRDRLEEIERHTRIPLIVYATDFLDAQKVQACGGQVDINLDDLQGFAEVTKDLPKGPLDVLLHSPGGSPEAAESIVQILRNRFNPIRFIIPVAAKSAATMIALSGNEILMPTSAELGPTDPQFPLSDGTGRVVLVPAQALIDQFRQAQQEIFQNQAAALAWSPVLQRYGIGLFQMCLNAIALSKELVVRWLTDYMFEGMSDAATKAQGIADYLVNHGEFKTHGRRINLGTLQSKGIKANDITSTDPTLAHLVERAWYAIQHTFGGTGAFKLFENSKRQCLVRVILPQIIAAPVMGPKGPS